MAVDGVTAAGKTTLANELADCLRDGGRRTVRLSMDGFHHPRARRYLQGRDSASGYYEDAYDFVALVEHVLVPLGPGGHGRYRRAVIDLDTDSRVDEAPVQVDPTTVLIVDGTFLQCSALARYWDEVVYVDTALDIARSRGIDRDHERLGGLDEARHAFDNRYHAAARIYLGEVSPAERADVVVDNNDPSHPVVHFVR